MGGLASLDLLFCYDNRTYLNLSVTLFRALKHAWCSYTVYICSILSDSKNGTGRVNQLGGQGPPTLERSEVADDPTCWWCWWCWGSFRSFTFLNDPAEALDYCIQHFLGSSQERVTFLTGPSAPSQELADNHGSNKLLCTTKLDKMLTSSANKRAAEQTGRYITQSVDFII